MDAGESERDGVDDSGERRVLGARKRRDPVGAVVEPVEVVDRLRLRRARTPRRPTRCLLMPCSRRRVRRRGRARRRQLLRSRRRVPGDPALPQHRARGRRPGAGPRVPAPRSEPRRRRRPPTQSSPRRGSPPASKPHRAPPSPRRRRARRRARFARAGAPVRRATRGRRPVRARPRLGVRGGCASVLQLERVHTLGERHLAPVAHAEGLARLAVGDHPIRPSRSPPPGAAGAGSSGGRPGSRPAAMSESSNCGPRTML